MNREIKRQVALSAGGRVEDLAPYGIGTEHMEELMVQMARDLLQSGKRLAFGGTLGVEGQDLTKTLIDTSQRWLDSDTAGDIKVTNPQTWPMVNYSAWPYFKSIADDYRARMVGICEFIDIKPEVDQKILDAATESYRARYTADALTIMRERITRESKLRIVWSGRIKGADGWMPGILEEVIMSLRFNKPLLILGGFGGCARLIADFLVVPENAKPPEWPKWPAAFQFKASPNPTRDSILTSQERAELEQRFVEAQKLLTEYRDALYSTDEINGIPTQLQKEMLLEDSMRTVKNAVLGILK